MVEVGLEVEDAAWIDTAFEDVIEKLRDISPRGRYTAAQTDVAR